MNISKIKYLFLLAPLLLFAFNSQAQSKFGHLDSGEILKSMPGIDSAEIVMTNFKENLQTIAEQMGKEFQDKQTEFEKLSNSDNTSQAVLKIRQDELMALGKRIQEFSQSIEDDIADKNAELLEPFRTKLFNAIEKIAKNEGYNYIFDVTTIPFYAPSDDLTDKVKAELGIK